MVELLASGGIRRYIDRMIEVEEGGTRYNDIWSGGGGAPGRGGGMLITGR